MSAYRNYCDEYGYHYCSRCDRSFPVAAETALSEAEQQIAQLQTTISQLDQMVTLLWDLGKFTPSIGCAFEENVVLKEAIARFKQVCAQEKPDGRTL